MNLLDIRAGDNVQVGVIVAWREWRYRLKPLTLLSVWWESEWSLDRFTEGNPDCSQQGLYALKSRPDRWGYDNSPDAGWHDGYVLGRVALWGVVWEHERGYRAQYARPLLFEEARGLDCERTLVRLRMTILSPPI